MQTLSSNGTLVQRILYRRPYHPWRYLPMSVFLSGREYPDRTIDRIVDFLADGGLLDSLIIDHTLDPEDADGAREALDEGRAWWAQYSGRGVPRSAAIVPPELEAGDGTESEPWDDDFDWDAPGEAPDEAITRAPGYREDLEHDGITLVPDDGSSEPTEADRAEWAEHLHESGLSFDPAKVEAMREWYRTRPSFEEWLAADGGPA
jgi:hypothetical protein